MLIWTFQNVTKTIRAASSSIPRQWCWAIATRIPMSTVSAGLPKSTVQNMSQLKNDVILYRYENPRYFRYLNLFAMAQLGVWTTIGYFATTLRDAPVPEEQEGKENLPFWKKVNLGEAKYKNAVLIICAVMGYAIFAVCWFLTLRSVRYIILRKDAKTAAFVTYTPFGQNRIMNVPLNCVSAAGSRAAQSSYIPIKVKNYRFFYLLDTKGEFVQPNLFDRTVGIQRKFNV